MRTLIRIFFLFLFFLFGIFMLYIIGHMEVFSGSAVILLAGLHIAIVMMLLLWMLWGHFKIGSSGCNDPCDDPCADPFNKEIKEIISEAEKNAKMKALKDYLNE